MTQLPREYLDDISSQRFQENVARQNNSLQKTVTSNNKTITDSLNSSVAELQNQIDALAETYIDIAFSIAPAATTTYTHGLGSIPSRWVIMDITSTNLADAAVVYRTGWTSSTITFQTGTTVALATVAGVIRVYK